MATTLVMRMMHILRIISDGSAWLPDSVVFFFFNLSYKGWGGIFYAYLNIGGDMSPPLLTSLAGDHSWK